MEKLDYPAYGRELYKTTLANGLKINLLPMPDYHKTYAILTTDFGSVDNTFVIDGQQQTVPNAFTSFTQTSYLFSTTAHLHESLDVLLDFVFDPYFTEQTVDKEKGIIGQEIRMYADSPDNRLYMGTLGNLYPEDPVKIDIAGSEDSIAKITPELLYQIHRTFYQPGNMNLFVVGNLDPDRVVEWVQANQTLANWPAAPLPVHTFAPVDPQANDVVPFATLEMPVARPKAMIGLRGISDFESGQERLRFVQSIGMALEPLFDDTSENYLRMYNEEVLDDSFGFGLEIERGFHFATFASETNRPEAFADAIIDILRRAPGELDAARDQFANRFSGHLFDQATIFDELASLESITFADLQNAVAQLIVPQRLSAFFVLPEGKQEI